MFIQYSKESGQLKVSRYQWLYSIITVSSLYSTYGNKAFACSGYYGSNIIFKLAFTSSTQARFVYGPSASTSVVTITGLSDTVIEIK